MRLIDADALEKEGWSLHRTIRVDEHTSEYQTKPLMKVPSAQPEIIRCRDCKFASGDSRICMKFGNSPIGELDFCAWAERRTDEA